jgi:hypothetical protein
VWYGSCFVIVRDGEADDVDDMMSMQL